MRKRDAGRLRAGDAVWLRAFEESPREKCELAGPMSEKGMFIGHVRPISELDDGLREFDCAQIERKV